MLNSFLLTSRYNDRNDNNDDDHEHILNIEENQNNNLLQKCVMKFASWTYDGFQVDMF